MDRELFSLALQGTLRKKRSSLLVFLVLLLSFAFGIFSLSVMGSIAKTNAEFRMETYGGWYFAIPAGREEDAAFLNTLPGVKIYGTMYNYGTVIATNGDVGKTAGFGVVDEAMREVGRLKVDEGRWPSTADEVALEADTLSALGYDYTLGQEIALEVVVPFGERKMTIKRTYTLCGIVHEFSELWMLNSNNNGCLPVSIIVTRDAAEQVLQAARDAAAKRQIDAQPDPALPQYFIALRQNDEETIQQVGKELSTYLRDTRDSSWGDRQPATNPVILESTEGAVSTDTYLALIALVALVAVLCVYFMQFPAAIHSAATLRSLGMSRLQLFELLLTETLLLLVPAMVLGVPCGAALTWAGLRLLAFTDSTAIQVTVPYGQIFQLVVVWVAVAVAARLILFVIAIRVPLTGRLRLQNAKARRVRTFRNSLIAVLLCVFGMAVIFPSREAALPQKNRKNYAEQDHYYFFWSVYDPETRKSVSKVFPQSAVEAVRAMPGIDRVTAYNEGDIDIAYPGAGRRHTTLLALEKADCAALDLGANQEAFEKGELVLLCFPDYDVPAEALDDFYWPEEQWYYLQPGEDLSDRDYPLPDGTIELYFYDREGTSLAQTSAAVAVRRIPASTLYHGRSLSDPYLVVCSSAYLQKVLAQMEPDANWNPLDRAGRNGANTREFIAGEEYGYQRVSAHADRHGNTEWADAQLAAFCEENGFSFMNNRSLIMANEQGEIQKIVMLYAMGACIALTALLVLLGALALETEQEARAFGTLRAIGMSKRQMWARVFGKAFGRSLWAGVGGWLVYLAYATAAKIHLYAHPLSPSDEPVWLTPAEALERVLSIGEIDFMVIVQYGCVCAAISLAVILLAKQHVGKGGLLQ